MYRKNRDVIDPIDDWWWLITPYSTLARYPHDVRYVNSDGSLRYNDAYYDSGGLRPALILKSDILVSTDGGHEEIEVDETTSAGIELVADYCMKLAKYAGITIEQMIDMVMDVIRKKEKKRTNVNEKLLY